MSDEFSSNLKVKFLRKAINKYPTETQEKFFKEYELLMHTILKANKSNESYFYYIDKAKKLSADEKTIMFYGVPIRLSKLQFAFLYLVLTDGSFSEDDYNELSIKSKNVNLTGNFKTFISRFHRKCLKSIEDYCKNNVCYFSSKNTKTIHKHLTNLLQYHKDNRCFNKYVAISNFQLKEESLIKKQQKA